MRGGGHSDPPHIQVFSWPAAKGTDFKSKNMVLLLACSTSTLQVNYYGFDMKVVSVLLFRNTKQ